MHKQSIVRKNSIDFGTKIRIDEIFFSVKIIITFFNRLNLFNANWWSNPFSRFSTLIVRHFETNKGWRPCQCVSSQSYVLSSPPIFQRLYDGKKPFELFISTKGSLLLAKTRSYKSVHSVEIYKNCSLGFCSRRNFQNVKRHSMPKTY